MKSRRQRKNLEKKLKRVKISSIVLGSLSAIYIAQRIVLNGYIFHPVQSLANTDVTVVTIEKPVEIVKEVEVDRKFTTQKQQILAYLVEKFGDRSDDAITMINTCENSTFNPQLINKSNNNGTWDVGVFQMNVDPKNVEEVARLQDWKYNIDMAYKKFQLGDYGKHPNSFYLWSCGDKAGDYTYKMKLEGK